MLIKAMIVEDDGTTPVLDSVTKEPHVMEFPFDSYVTSSIIVAVNYLLVKFCR